MADISHVVVLMLENRSFDCMLGRLYPFDPDYRGLTLNEINTYGGMPYSVWNDPTMDAITACIPKPDPGELFSDITQQLYNGAARGVAQADMGGFVANYASQKPSRDGAPNPRDVMHYFSEEQVPVLSTLAKAFGVCDAWHASAPCQTWPNRFFAHTGTAMGHVDNHTFPVPYPAESLFHRLEKAGKSWRVYFHDMPQSLLLRDVWLYALFHYRRFKQFLADAHSGALPQYSFIEPRYFTDLFSSSIPNDEHPPHDVIYGEQLIAAVYNAVRSSPCWKTTLLIITYDEHGGCYDHVVPPPAVAPDTHAEYGFGFNQYGVRVPAVLVSPYIPPGTKVRPTVHANGNLYPFDHTSIIATVRELFLPGSPPLTGRDAVAPTLLPALSLTAPSNDGPLQISAEPASPAISELQARSSAPPTAMQAALGTAAKSLPAAAPSTGPDVPAPAPPQGGAPATVALAQVSAVAGTNRFLGA